MINRKFNIKKDYAALNEMENKFLPILEEIQDKEKKADLKKYIRELFFKQFKE